MRVLLRMCVLLTLAGYFTRPHRRFLRAKRPADIDLRDNCTARVNKSRPAIPLNSRTVPVTVLNYVERVNKRHNIVL